MNDAASTFLALMASLLGLMLLKVGFVGMAILFDLRWPNASERMLDAYQTRARRCTVIGAVNAFACTIVFLILASTNNPVPIFLAILLLLFVGALVVFGYGIAYLDLGLRLSPDAAQRTRTQNILLGGIAAESAFLMPALGQLLSLATLLRGLGAVAITLLSRSPSPEE